MKKIIAILLGLLVLFSSTSCRKEYKYVIDYELVYSDTTFVRTYSFDGSEQGHYRILDNSSTNGKLFYVFPRKTSMGYSIAAVPEGASINITDYKIYRYGIDISEKEKK